MIDLEKQYQEYLNKNIYINMSRGVPDARQLDLSESILDVLRSGNCLKINNIDYRNYGLLDGIPECKDLFSNILDVESYEIEKFAQLVKTISSGDNGPHALF